MQNANLDGLMIYTKGKLVEEAGVDHTAPVAGA